MIIWWIFPRHGADQLERKKRGNEKRDGINRFNSGGLDKVWKESSGNMRVKKYKSAFWNKQEWYDIVC